MLKLCRKCGEHKDLTEFRWLNIQKRYLSQCKDCEREYGRGRYLEQNGDTRQRDIAIIIKICKKHGTGIIQDAINRLEQE